MVSVDVDPGVTAGSMDGKMVRDIGFMRSLISRPAPLLSISLLLLGWSSSPMFPPPSERRSAAMFLEQCRQRSLRREDQYDGHGRCTVLRQKFSPNLRAKPVLFVFLGHRIL